MTYKVYKITSPSPHLCYVGITSQRYISTRHRQHCYDHRTNKSYCGAYAIVKYADSIIELIESVDDKHEALRLESEYIASFGSCTSNVNKKRNTEGNDN